MAVRGGAVLWQVVGIEYDPAFRQKLPDQRHYLRSEADNPTTKRGVRCLSFDPDEGRHLRVHPDKIGVDVPVGNQHAQGHADLAYPVAV